MSNEVMDLIMEFLEKLQEVEPRFDGVLYTGGTITFSDRDSVIEGCEMMDIEIPDEILAEETVIVMIGDDSDEEPEGYLQ